MLLTIPDEIERSSYIRALAVRYRVEEELIRNLEKTGDTVFIPRETRAKTAGAFVPVSRVNGIRREALEKLAEERIRRFEGDSDSCSTIQNSEFRIIPRDGNNEAAG